MIIKAMRPALLFLFLFCGVSLFAQQSKKIAVDTVLMGEWKLANPADAKMMKSAGEPFLRESMYFSNRGRLSVPGESHNWGWNTANGNIITIIDEDLYEGIDYLVEKLDREELVIVWGDHGYKLRYLRVKKEK